MFYLIRDEAANDVLGIISVQEVIDPPIHLYSPRDNQWVQLRGIIEWNLNLGSVYWNQELISQAEYETYRDLHGLKVLRD